MRTSESAGESYADPRIAEAAHQFGRATDRLSADRVVEGGRVELELTTLAAAQPRPWLDVDLHANTCSHSRGAVDTGSRRGDDRFVRSGSLIVVVALPVTAVFHRQHGQMRVGPNGIELHPALPLRCQS